MLRHICVQQDKSEERIAIGEMFMMFVTQMFMRLAVLLCVHTGFSKSKRVRTRKCYNVILQSNHGHCGEKEKNTISHMT